MNSNYPSNLRPVIATPPTGRAILFAVGALACALALPPAATAAEAAGTAKPLEDGSAWWMTPMNAEAAAMLKKLRESEISQMKVAGKFTLAVGGDVIQTVPIANLEDPSVQGVLKIIRGADVAFANSEANMTDYLTETGQVGVLTGPKEIAADLKAQGFDILQRSSNHSTTMGTDRMLKSNAALTEVGLPFAGSGRNLQEARAPAYAITPKGRVGLVSMFSYPALNYQQPFGMSSVSDSGAGQAATYQMGNRGGLPCVNPMRLFKTVLVPQEDLDALRRVATATAEGGRKTLADYKASSGAESTARPPNFDVDQDPKSPVVLNDVRYALGPRGGLSYRMYPDDEAQNMRSIRQAKEAADFVITSIHSHESPSAYQFDFMQQQPTDFLVKLAHEAIDNGADAFVGTGVHVLRGIEIYKGRPIFYGMMSYIYQITNTPIAYDRYRDNGLNPFTTEYTENELNWKGWPPLNVLNHPDPMNNESMESVVGQATYQDGKLTEVRIYPIDFGYGRPMSQKGTPRLSTGIPAQRILSRMQRISKVLGTNLTIQDNVGIIKVGADGKSQ